MTQLAATAKDFVEPPPSQKDTPLLRLWRTLFGSTLNSAITVMVILALVWLVPKIVNWAILDATWTGVAADCRKASGACWAFIAEKARVMVFGVYPGEELWRPTLMMLLFIGMVGVSMFKRLWRRELIWAWIALVPVLLLLMDGRILFLIPVLPVVPTNRWSGLPVTLLLSLFGLVLAFPLAILVALGRRSTMPVIRVLSVCYIELIRGVPLITVLFMASLIFPLFLPAGMTVDKLLRAQIAIILFAAAYLAEVVRAGLQGIPRGQYEAADSLGLTYWQSMRLIILPQALKMVIPPLVNTFIGFFKDTTLIIIVGLFDFLFSVRAPLADPNWLGFPTEAYVFAAAVYFCFCFIMSKYSQYLERELSPERRR
ncbi:MAG: amino acid ABC transporter permease [Alphaproteobacteria bacterium]|nr:amino acid ABC transporter permease [Alphaproteobacteria bacterium]